MNQHAIEERPAAPPDVDLERAWDRIAGEVWASEPGWLERTAARALRSAALARTLVTTPSLILSWLLASALVIAIGVLTSRAGDPWVALLAPALAGIGVAYAYGPGIDDAWELSATMATPAWLILLVRVLAVFAINAVLGLAASLAVPVAVPAASRVAWTWLIPMAAVSAVTLAAALLSRSALAGCLVGTGLWTAVVSAVWMRAGETAPAVTGATFLIAYAFVAVAATCFIVVEMGWERKGTLTWRT